MSWTSINLNQNWEVLFNLGVLYASKFLLALISLIIGLYIISKITKFLKKILKKRELDESLIQFLSSLLSWGLRILLLVSVASMVGIVTTSFVTVIGAAGLAIGLALQGSLSNFAGGVIIMLFKPFKTGDYIEAQGQEGQVVSIDIFATRLLKFDNTKVVIPNGPLANGTLVNHTAETKRRIDLPIGISYKDSADKAIEALDKMCKGHSKVLSDPPPYITVSSYGDSSINLTVRAWVNTDDYWPVRFELTKEIKPVLDKAQITIPFPQRDLHVFKDSNL